MSGAMIIHPGNSLLLKLEFFCTPILPFPKQTIGKQQATNLTYLINTAAGSCQWSCRGPVGPQGPGGAVASNWRGLRCFAPGYTPMRG